MRKTISERFQLAISLSTVSRGCKKLNYHYKPPKHKQALTPKQIADRVSFAYTLITMYYSNEIDLGSIVFSDESRFVLGDDKRWVWRRHGEDNPTAYKQTDKFVSVLPEAPTPIKETEFTKEEDKVILQYYMKLGPRWDKISTIVSGRSAVQIKNRCNTVIKKNIITGKFDI